MPAPKGSKAKGSKPKCSNPNLPRPPVCYLCASPAVVRCDAETGPAPGTCDRHLCETHATKSAEVCCTPQYYCPDHAG